MSLNICNKYILVSMYNETPQRQDLHKIPASCMILRVNQYQNDTGSSAYIYLFLFMNFSLFSLLFGDITKYQEVVNRLIIDRQNGTTVISSNHQDRLHFLTSKSKFTLSATNKSIQSSPQRRSVQNKQNICWNLSQRLVSGE